MNKSIPLSIPNFEGNEGKYVNDALNQGWVSTGGAYITRLEEELAKFLKVKKVAACQSGTSALHLSLIACGVMPEDIVIVPTITFIAAVNPVKYQFAAPVFMDCDDSLCIDPKKLNTFCENECELVEEELIHKSTRKKVKALIVVHVFGNLADMETIMEIASKYHITVIEDATEALGTHYVAGRYQGKYAGTIGDFGAFSFNGNKIITTGGGGAVTANDENTVNHLQYLSTQAKDDTHYYIHNEVGYNYRMTNLQAALGVAQLEELQMFIERKNRNYFKYKEYFQNFQYGRMLEFREGTSSNRWFYSLEIPMEKIKGTLRDIITALQTRGIETRAIWGLIHEQLPYKNEIAYQIDKAHYYGSCILNLPCSTQLTEEELQYVVTQVKDILEEMSNE